MVVHHEDNHDFLLDTSWMPLDGIAEQWGRFGTEGTSVPALHATGAVFSALARETEAREYRMTALHSSHDVDLTDLESALEELDRAREHWTDAITVLGLLVGDRQAGESARGEARTLVAQVMEQRLRISSLILAVEKEQFKVYCKGM